MHLLSRALEVAAQVSTVPSLVEWRASGDKKALHHLYGDYYDQVGRIPSRPAIRHLRATL